MLTAKDYERLAKITANGFRAARDMSGEDGHEMIYENVYLPLVDFLKDDNERFDNSLFCYRVAQLINS